MNRPSLLRLAGTILIAASAFVFLLGFVSGFYGHFAVVAFLTIIFVLMLYLGNFLIDKGDERTDRHKRELASATKLIRLYADKYHDKDAEHANKRLEALGYINLELDYHIQRVRDLYRMQVQAESDIIDIAGKIRKAYGADKTCH